MYRLSISQEPKAGGTYPFVSDGAGLENVLFDLCLPYLPREHAVPFRVDLTTLGWSAGTGLQLLIKDADNSPVFSTATATFLGFSNWGTDYRVWRWDAAGRIVTVITGVFAALPDGLDELTGAATLDPRVYQPVLDTVTELRFVDPKSNTAIPHNLNTSLEIVHGYNNASRVVAPPRTGSGLRLPTRYELAAVAGSGMGKLNNCDEAAVPLLRRISGLSSETGNFELTDDPCIRVSPVVALEAGGQRTVPGLIDLIDNCAACCDCDDYLAVARGIMATASRIGFAEQSVSTVRDRVRDAKDTLKTLIECSQRPVQLRLSANGNCGILVSTGLFNRTAVTIQEAVLEVRVYQLKAGEAGLDVWEPTKLDGVPGLTDVYQQSASVGAAEIEQIAKHRLRFSLGCIDSGRTRSIMLSLWVPHSGDFLVAAKQIPAANKNDDLPDDTPNNANVLCDRITVRCTPADRKVASKLLSKL